MPDVTAPVFHRYVALGDSFTEGVGDPDPDAPQRAARLGRPGRRGAGDPHRRTSATPTSRSAAARCARSSTEQLEPALALEPDLVTIYAGGNDLLRPRFDVDALGEVYDEAIGRLAATGATVGLFTAFDPGAGGPFGRLRGRFAVYNERVREIADRHGAVVLDSWRMRPDNPETVWSEDRLHLGPLGHQAVAIEVLDSLGVPHDLVPVDPTAILGHAPFRPGRRADLSWVFTPRRPVGASPPDRAVVGRRRTTQAAGAGADLRCCRAARAVGYDPCRRSRTGRRM